MFNGEIEKILRLTDEELFHEKDYAKVSLIEKKSDIEYLKNILTEILELNNIKSVGYQNILVRINEVFRKIQNMFNIMKSYNGENKNNIIAQIDSLIAELQSKYVDVLALISYEKTKNINSRIAAIELKNLSNTLKIQNDINLKINEIENIKKQILKYEQDAQKAEEIISIVDVFYKEVEFLYKELEKRND